MTLTQVHRRIKKSKRLRNLLLVTIGLSWYLGVLLPLGYFDEGTIKWQTGVLWALAGLSLIGLQMILCSYLDRLRLVYERKQNRMLRKQRQYVYNLEAGRHKKRILHEVRSA